LEEDFEREVAFLAERFVCDFRRRAPSAPSAIRPFLEIFGDLLRVDAGAKTAGCAGRSREHPFECLIDHNMSAKL